MSTKGMAAVCRARSEGGQRCSGHARAALSKAADRYADAYRSAHREPLTLDGHLRTPVSRKLLRAECALAEAMAQYASTGEGRAELEALRDSAGTNPDAALDDPMDDAVCLQVALIEGQRLRERAAFVRDEVRSGRMSPEYAKEVSRYPSEAASAFARSDLWLSGRQTGYERQVRNEGQRYRWATAFPMLGSAEQAAAWHRAAAMLDGRSFVQATAQQADNDLFDARVRLVADYGEMGEAMLERQRDGIPREGEANVRARRDIDYATEEGRRHREVMRDLWAQQRAGLITREEYDQRIVFPSVSVANARMRALYGQFGRLPGPVNSNWH